LSDIPKNVKINAIKTLKMTNYSLTQEKLALSNQDDSRVWMDKTSSRAYGHFQIKKMTNYSLTQEKFALSKRDDSRVWMDKTSSRAYGHFRN
jgi:uncharacterized membrane protein YheB (UPF0754 family)